MNRIRPVISLGIICILTIVITGCNILKKDVKTDTDVSKAKELMIEKLDNYMIDVVITSHTSLADVQIRMNCIEDNKNKLEYCNTSTLGIIDTEQYIDYNNNKSYTKTEYKIDIEENTNKWEVKDIKKNRINSWININDYLRKLEVTKTSNGKLYKGTISIKKLKDAISDTDKSSNIKFPTIDNKDIPIEIFINNKGYIEYANTEFDLLSIKETINIKYHNYDGNAPLKLPTV